VNLLAKVRPSAVFPRTAAAFSKRFSIGSEKDGSLHGHG
jgi:hypothetical protein